MVLQEESLLYCAYAIAIFDLLCAVLFAVLSLCLILNHLSWLTIFCVCFGVFWITLILLLISGIYRRDSDMVRYWLMFSCFGIMIESILIVYAFMSHTTFQSGVVRNSFILCLGLFVEAIFAFIIYQFYLTVSSCNVCLDRRSSPDCSCTPTYSETVPQVEPDDSRQYQRLSRKTSKSYRHNILQSRHLGSPYTCGVKSSTSAFKRNCEEY
ncbi:uncharacterized protein LOC132792730 [Drosophila nasuta]|uniref:uncharacterized protein LOC132792730 n=1 Tax=Drosophila nasuta TaxID=42062 RepID=UPI00295EF514|nr:uncharacterized protein LOC132792730 [Drosophila nasuta]